MRDLRWEKMSRVSLGGSCRLSVLVEVMIENRGRYWKGGVQGWRCSRSVWKAFVRAFGP